MAQNDEKQHKPFLPTQQLIQNAKGKVGDHEYDEAIRLYEQALGGVDQDSGDAAEIRSFLIRAIAEQVELLTRQISAKAVPTDKLDQTFDKLLGLLENLKALEQQNIQIVSILEDKEQELAQEKEDLEKDKQKLDQEKENLEKDKQKLDQEKGLLAILLALGHLIDTMRVKLISGLSASVWRWFCLFIVALVITVASPALLNWYFNNSSLKLCGSGTITIKTSSSLQPLLQAEAQKYHQHCSDAIIMPSTASPDGIAQVDTNPTVTIGTAETFAYTTQHQLWDNQVGIVTFALIVNKQAGVSNLTTENIREIYSRRVVNWHQVCSLKNKKEQQCGQPQSINIIGRPIDSDVRAAFEQYVLGSAEYIASPTTSDVDNLPQGNGIIQDVINTPGAIGYVTLNAAQTAHLSPVSIDGVAPTAMSVNSGAYKFWSIEHFYTRGAATGLTQKFSYFMHTDDAISLLHHYGFQSMTDISGKVLRNHVEQGT